MVSQKVQLDESDLEFIESACFALDYKSKSEYMRAAIREKIRADRRKLRELRRQEAMAAYGDGFEVCWLRCRDQERLDLVESEDGLIGARKGEPLADVLRIFPPADPPDESRRPACPRAVLVGSVVRSYEHRFRGLVGRESLTEPSLDSRPWLGDHEGRPPLRHVDRAHAPRVTGESRHREVLGTARRVANVQNFALYLAVSCWSASQRPVGTSTCCW